MNYLVAGFRGTVKYAPVACHAQRELCRLDDLETWLYMISLIILDHSLNWIFRLSNSQKEVFPGAISRI